MNEPLNRLWAAFAGLSFFAKAGLIAAVVVLIAACSSSVGLWISHRKDAASRALQAEEKAKRDVLELDKAKLQGEVNELRKNQATLEVTIAAKDKLINDATRGVRAADERLDKVNENAQREMAALPDAQSLTPDEWRERLRRRLEEAGFTTEP